jgi:hypothetical protein
MNCAPLNAIVSWTQLLRTIASDKRRHHAADRRHNASFLA